MKHQLKTAILTATLSLSSILALDITAQALPPVENNDSSTMPSAEPSQEANTGTQFTCVPQNNGSVATVGQRPGGQAIPLIIWTAASSKYFGKKFTPQYRCQIVTPKLNQAVAESGGRLKNVVLMTGQINKNTVICVVSAKEKGCSDRNTLFTMKPENAKQANKILAQIMQISREGSAGGVIRETGGRVQINLNDLLKNNVNSLVKQPIEKPAVQNPSGGL